MKQRLQKLLSPATTVVLFVLAIGLLGMSSIGGARAALTYFSETYVSEVQMYDIGVSLLENGERVAWRDYQSNSNGKWSETPGENHMGKLLETMLGEDEALKPGKAYDEVLSVRNSGTINEYVRVNLYKYWLDPDGNKCQELTPDLIDLHLLTGGDWVLDESASTPERTVLYYTHLLDAGQTSSALSDTLTIDQLIASKVKRETKENGEIVLTYAYDGYQFCIEAEVDAVQEHNAEDAAWSAWGRKVKVANGRLSLS